METADLGGWEDLEASEYGAGAGLACQDGVRLDCLQWDHVANFQLQNCRARDDQKPIILVTQFHVTYTIFLQLQAHLDDHKSHTEILFIIRL